MRKPYATRRRKKGARSLTQVSRQIRNEFRPLYLKNQFRYIYSTDSSLKKFLQSFLTGLPKNSKMKLVILFRTSCATEDFRPIFELIAAAHEENHEVDFQCSDWHPTTAEIMTRAAQQKSLWREWTSQLKQITCKRNNNGVALPTVHLLCGRYGSQQDRDEREKACDVWNSLGFAVT